MNWFRPTKEEVVQGLETLRERICCYVGTRCDCKYLTPDCDMRRGSEQTGCCEVRAAIEFLNKNPFFSQARQCIICGVIVSDNFYQKCDKCFQQGKEACPPRQSGRTCATLKVMTRDDIFLVPRLGYATNLMRSHPWLKDNIATPDTLGHVMRGKKWRGVLRFDHTMSEQRPEAMRDALAFFEKHC